MPQNDQIWPKIGIFGQFGPRHAGLFNALLWVGWWLWRAGCISQDTYLLYNDLLKKRRNICIIRSHSGPEHFPTASYPNGFQGRLELIEVHGRSLILISDCTRPNNHFPTDKLSFCHGCSREPESLTSRPVGSCLPHKI